MIYEALQDDLSAHNYGGVVLTITGYEKAWENNIEDALVDFVDRVSNIAKRHRMPLHLPRSSWFGAYLTDVGVNGFGSLFNGNERYTSGGGMDSDNMHYRYRSTAVYDHAVDPTIDIYESHFDRNGGQAHPIDGLPDKPPVYNPKGDSYQEKFGQPREYRINYGKPRRLVHSLEAREIRKGIKLGLLDPAKRYLDSSSHSHIS